MTLKSDNMMYLKQSGFHTHGNCVNFSSGLCTLNNVAVDPGGTACPNFIPKNVTSRPQIRHRFPPYTVHPWSSLQARYNYPLPYTPPPHTWYDYPTRHSYSPIPSTATAPRGAAGFLFMSRGRGGRGGGGGRGRGRMGGFAAGPGGSCVCPNCGYHTPHVIGTPCYQQTCPKCGSRMTRGR